ncbi:hypothetical protein ACQPYH_18525 [Kribbella sp. CA-245084]
MIAWLVPIFRSEARYVVSRGWEASEDRLVEQDPELTDFARLPMAL